MSKKNGKIDKAEPQIQNFVSVYDGNTRLIKAVSCDLYTAAKTFVDIYDAPNATNGAMLKVVNDMQGQYVDMAAAVSAEQTGNNFGYSLDIDWSLDALSHDGPKATITKPGMYASVFDKMPMSALSEMVKSAGDNNVHDIEIHDDSFARLLSDMHNYVSQFDNVDLVKKDVRAYNRNLESVFRDTFCEYYTWSIPVIGCSVVTDFEEMKKGIKEKSSNKRFEELTLSVSDLADGPEYV